MTSQVEGPAPPGNRPEDRDATKLLDTSTLPPAADIENACEAFAVVVITPAGKYVRRVFLSLHSATAAMQRALGKGQPACIVLCRLVPVTADLKGRSTA
jgi:hypothetical protein